ncbi:MAG: DUF1688 family protein [Polyangiaceae bacterium]|nr:DUF1688 family protein [Polyangiaceae bacterium]
MPRTISGTRTDVSMLRRTDTTRASCGALLARARRGDSAHFEIVDDAVDGVVDYVAASMCECPSRRALHGRMRHFDTGGRRRTEELERRLPTDAEERARVKIDLVVPSVLLDAGAGPRWRYRDDDAQLARSEGLAVASFRMFMAGAFAADGESLRTDAGGLAALDEDSLGRALQVRDDNPIVGLEGRAHILTELANALRSDRDRFGSAGRPGHLFDWAKRQARNGKIAATDLLEALLDGLSSIWPGRFEIGGENIGDVWPHPALGAGVDALVPFHKLSQWLTLSLIEPMLDGGIEVVGLEGLTHLPEYRNGGLLIDLGVISLRDPAERTRAHRVDDTLVVEWRALTVALLDEIVPRVQARLAAPGDPVALAGFLEAATWLAGRRIAADRRPGGGPPIAIESDGTVF